MNTQIQAAFDHALLARAVYMALNEIAEQGKTLKQVLTSGSSPFSPALADYLASRYQVVETYNMGDNVSGYNGALFVGIVENDNENKYVFANRGTEPTDPFDLVADLLLAISGANQQIPVMQAYFEQALLKVNGNPLTVTGHSLGGYLSVMLQNPAENAAHIKKTYTFNGAGIFNVALTGSIVNAALIALGYEPITVSPSLPIENYYTVEGLTVTAATGFYGGVRIPVNTDVIGLGGVAGLEGHSIANLTDALAVYNLLGMVDSDITLAELNVIHEAISKDGLIENDALVKAFGSLLINSLSIFNQDTKNKVNQLNVTQNNNSDMHEAIYAMVQQLQTTPQALQITPLVSFNESGQLQLHTNQDINSLAYRYALKELNPFVVEGLNYSSFNQSGQLDDYNEGGAANDTSYRLAA